MSRINAAYEKGEFVLIFYIPFVVAVALLVVIVPEHFLLFTYNMVAVLDFALLSLLLVALALVYTGISEVSEKRLKTTDWFLRIILFCYLVMAVVMAGATLLLFLLMADPSPTHELLREGLGYRGATRQLLRAVVMGAGAWLWLRGIRRTLPAVAITGAILLLATLLPFPRIIQTSAMPPVTEFSDSGGDMDEAGAFHRPPLQLGRDKLDIGYVPSRTLKGAKFYPVALLLLTFMRYGKRQRELKAQTAAGNEGRTSESEPNAASS